MYDSVWELADQIALGESTYLELQEVRFAGMPATSRARFLFR